MQLNFEHKPAAHCESGVTSNILRFYGVDLSEPMVLGLGSGLFFSHMPFITLHGIAVTSFRPLPGQIFSRVTKKLGITVKKRRFLNKDASMEALDKLLAQGIPVGVLVGVYHLSYFPKEYRFHFNAHNICVMGKEGNEYIVSDPVLTSLARISYDELKRVRYAKGTYPPYGKMYWIKKLNKDFDLKKAIIKAIELNCKRMLKIPIPYFGVKGIRVLAKKMRNWEQKYGSRKAALCLAQVIRMLEEIGTGGAGFRFMYAAFLQEAASVLENPDFREYSKQMTHIGDQWREFATEAARKFKNRNDSCSYNDLANKLDVIANNEEALFKELRKAIRKKD